MSSFHAHGVVGRGHETQLNLRDFCLWSDLPVKHNYISNRYYYYYFFVILNMSLNLFTTIHDGNFRRHSSMNVTIK